MTSQQLSVRLVQWASDLDPAVNRARLASVPADGEPDLVVLPEAFAREFGDPSEPLGAYAEALDGPFGQAVGALASQLDTTVVAGMFETRATFPAGLQHPPRREATSRRAIARSTSTTRSGMRSRPGCSRGRSRPATFDLGGFRFGLMTCYDLRFPELAAGLVATVRRCWSLPAAWLAGERKVDHWRTLVRARAIENTVHVIAVGQPAPRYCGHSMVVDPLGDVLVEAGPDETVLDAVLSRSALDEARRTNPSLANRRL